MGIIDMVNGRLCETLPIEEIERIRDDSYNQALKDFYSECERISNYGVFGISTSTMKELKDIVVHLIK